MVRCNIEVQYNPSWAAKPSLVNVGFMVVDFLLGCIFAWLLVSLAR